MDLNAVAGLGAMVKGAARWWDSYDTYAGEFNNRMGDGYYTGEDVFGQLAYEYARHMGVSPEEAEARLGRWADTAIQHHNYGVLNKFVADNSDDPSYTDSTLGQHFDSLQQSVPGLWGRNGTKRKIETERRLMDRGGYLRSQPVVHGMTGHQILDRGDAMKRDAVANLKRQSFNAAPQPVQVQQPEQVQQPVPPQQVQAPTAKRMRKARSARPVQAPQAAQAQQSEADYWENVRKQTDIQMYGVARERDPQTGKLLPPVRPGMAKAPTVKRAGWEEFKAVAPFVVDGMADAVAHRYPGAWRRALSLVSGGAGAVAPAIRGRVSQDTSIEQRRGWGGAPQKPQASMNGADGLWNGHAPAKPKPYDPTVAPAFRRRLAQGWETMKRQISEQDKASK